MKIGIDAGGTLTKVACTSQSGRILYTVPTQEIDSLIDRLNREEAHEYFLTGGRATYIKERLNDDAVIINEFDATYTGLKQLLIESGESLDKFVYLNVGTGTSVHIASDNAQARIGGSGVGGGTLMGLAQLLTGLTSFDEIIQMSKSGNRDTVDLKVHHIYGDDTPPIAGDLTASNFANVFNNHHLITDADKLSAVIGLIAETVTTIGLTISKTENIKEIVFIGATLIDNSVMRDIIERYATLLGARPIIINDGEYSGALGALLFPQNNDEVTSQS